MEAMREHILPLSFWLAHLLILLVCTTNIECLIISKDGDVPELSVFTKLNASDLQSIRSLCGIPTWRRYPWAISFLSEKHKNKLGGTIISPYHILTAAHGFAHFQSHSSGDPCGFFGYRTFPTLVNERIIAYGDDCIRSDGSRCTRPRTQFNRIRAVYVDSSFFEGGCLSGHDWALVEVQQPMVFSDSVRPICLPSASNPPAISGTLTVAGWGKPKVISQGDSFIREVPMRYDANCKAPWSDWMPTGATVSDYLCAHAMNEADDDSPRTCYGDSGAGVQQPASSAAGGAQRATLMGITSYGSRGCPPNELARFTRISMYASKICALIGLCDN